jgi:hypothetical protein
MTKSIIYKFNKKKYISNYTKLDDNLTKILSNIIYKSN